MKKLAACLLPLVMFALFSCGDNDDPGSKTIYPTDPSTKHTMLYYMGIDNNFREEKYKIETLRRAWSPDYDANLLIYADGGSNTVLVHIHHDKYGESVADTLKVYERENSASKEVFSRVLKDVYEGYPAETNGLLILSHATGWLKQGKLGWPRTRTVVDDTGEGDQLDLWDFAEGIPKKLDYIIFDACLMSGVEVMSELYGKTKYVLACPPEILVEYIDYGKMPAYLFKSSGPDLKGVVDYIHAYAEAQTHPYFAMSMTDVDQFKEMEDFCRYVFDGDGSDIESRLDFKSLQQFLPRGAYTSGGKTYDVYPFYTDLGDIIENLEPDLYKDFKAILDKCVVYSQYTPYFYSAYSGPCKINSYSGLTMYIQRADFPDVNEDYKILKWYKNVFAQ